MPVAQNCTKLQQYSNSVCEVKRRLLLVSGAVSSSEAVSTVHLYFKHFFDIKYNQFRCIFRNNQNNKMSSIRHNNITLTKFTYFGSNINTGHPSLPASPPGSDVTLT